MLMGKPGDELHSKLDSFGLIEKRRVSLDLSLALL